jgi:hypothetical protein
MGAAGEKEGSQEEKQRNNTSDSGVQGAPMTGSEDISCSYSAIVACEFLSLGAKCSGADLLVIGHAQIFFRFR